MEFIVCVHEESKNFAVRFQNTKPLERFVLENEAPDLPTLTETVQGSPKGKAFPLPWLFRAVWPQEPDLPSLLRRFFSYSPEDPWERAEILGRLFLQALEQTSAWPPLARRALSGLLPQGIVLPSRRRPRPSRPSASLDEAFHRLELAGLEEREEQRAYAQAVWEALSPGKIVLLEAGPGTGKTFGYLIPLLLRLRQGGRAVVATRTRTLQDQLYQRDLPWLEENLGLRMPRALLKGRENYLCLWRLRRLRALLIPEDILIPLELLALRGAHLDEVDFVGEVGLLEEIRDRPGRCLGIRCPELACCPYRLAREEARAAQLLVVNHALLGADLARENAILGPYDYLVVDEAHALPAALREALSVILNPQDIPELLADLPRPGEGETLDPLAEEVHRAHEEFWDLVQRVTPSARSRIEPEKLKILEHAAAPLRQALARLGQAMQKLETLSELGATLVEEARKWALFFQPDGEDWVAWSQKEDTPVLNLTPLDLAPRLQDGLWSQVHAAILTSATLAVPGKPGFIAQRLGLPEHVEFRTWPSPFGYDRVRIVILSHLPEPDAPGYAEALAETIRYVLGKTPAKTLVLFTSRRALAEVHEALANVPHLAQGWDCERDQLLRRFRALPPPAILLGLESFWEGVDLPREELEILVIARLPFPSPGDPALDAEAQRLRAQGRSDFRELFLPLAVLKLRQGLGRLVRTPADRGVILLADPRLCSRTYRNHFLRVLPVEPQIVQGLQELDVVLAQVFG